MNKLIILFVCLILVTTIFVSVPNVTATNITNQSESITQTWTQNIDDIAKIQNCHPIWISGRPFYPSLGEPIISENLKKAHPDSRDYFLLQFSETPTQAMKDTIKELGCTFHQYFQENTYLVEADSVNITETTNLPFVDYFGLYQPAYKFPSDLLDRSGEIKLIVTLFDDVNVSAVVGLIRNMGVKINRTQEKVTNLIECSCDASGIYYISHLKEVYWIEQYAESTTCMDIITSNAYMGHDTPQQVGGFTGSMVLGEVQDVGCQLTHPDLNIQWTDGPVSAQAHGTCITGTIFSSGAGSANAQGILYEGTGAFADWSTGRGTSIANLWNGNFNEGDAGQHGVFQSNSWSSGWVNGAYSTYSNQDDSATVNYPHVLTVWCMANSPDGTNLGQCSQDASAKNVIAVGAIFHKNTASLSDDDWHDDGAGKTPSRGPAADGRQKPELCGPFDWIYTTDATVWTQDSMNEGYVPGAYYNQFGGTSGATPIVAGSGGLIYDMYIQNFFRNNPTNQIPYSSTVKALLIADAHQYEMNPTNQITRNVQGWGTPDLENTYNLGSWHHYINDCENSVGTGSSWPKSVTVDGSLPLKITLAWVDSPATPQGSGSTKETRSEEPPPPLWKALINDLDLQLISPSGVEYWGNNGLFDSLYSAPGEGLNHWSRNSDYTDDLNNVENVFIETPEAGTWYIRVIGSHVVENPMNPTGTAVQPFSLVASGINQNDWFFIDTSTPSNIPYPGPSSTGSKDVTLRINEKNYNADFSQMRFSNDNTGQWSAWESYSPTKPWTLSGGVDGYRTVSCEVQDVTGKIWEATDSIIWDTTPPTTTHTM